MGIYLRRTAGKRSPEWWVDCDWRGQGIPRIQRSTHSTNKTRANAMMRTVESLRDAGRRDLLAMIADGRLSLADVHELWQTNRAELEHAAARAVSPALGPLVDEWLEWLHSPAAISPRTRRPFAPRTIERYAQSWQGFFAALPNGRDAFLSDLTSGFCVEYRSFRKQAKKSGATVNRDLVALKSFLRWAEEVKGLSVPRLKVQKERESSGRERYLTADDLVALRDNMSPEWWPLFALLVYTGLRVGEAQGLRWADVRLTEKRLSVHGRYGRRLKTAGSARDVPIPEELAAMLAQHEVTVPNSSTDLVFPGRLGAYRSARRAFQKATKAAGLHDITIHDLRHTFGVHAAQAGVPMARLQKLLGHSTPAMTMRYAAHSPEAYFEPDAAAIAASLNGTTAQERAERAAIARTAIKIA